MKNIIAKAKTLQSILSLLDSFRSEETIKTANSFVLAVQAATEANHEKKDDDDTITQFIEADQLPQDVSQTFLAAHRLVLQGSGNIVAAMQCVTTSALSRVGMNHDEAKASQHSFIKVSVFTKLLAKTDSREYENDDNAKELRPYVVLIGEWRGCLAKQPEGKKTPDNYFNEALMDEVCSLAPILGPELWDKDALKASIQSVKNPNIDVFKPFRTYDSGIALREAAEEALNEMADVETIVKDVQLVTDSMANSTEKATKLEWKTLATANEHWMAFKVSARTVGDSLAKEFVTLAGSVMSERTVAARLKVTPNSMTLSFLALQQAMALSVCKQWGVEFHKACEPIVASVGLEMALPITFDAHKYSAASMELDSLLTTVKSLQKDIAISALSPKMPDVSNQDAMTSVFTVFESLLAASLEVMSNCHKYALTLSRTRMALRDESSTDRRDILFLTRTSNGQLPGNGVIEWPVSGHYHQSRCPIIKWWDDFGKAAEMERL